MPNLDCLNANRAVLGAHPIDQLKYALVKTGVNPPSLVARDPTISVPTIVADIEVLKNCTSSETQLKIGGEDRQLREAVLKVKENPKLSHSLHTFELTQLGLKLLDESGAFPLCGSEWPEEELSGRFEERLKSADEARNIEDLIAKTSDSISNYGTESHVRLEKLAGCGKTLVHGVSEALLG